MNNIYYPKAAEINAVAKDIFTGEYEPIAKAVDVAANYYASSLEFNFAQLLRAEYVRKCAWSHNGGADCEPKENAAAEAILTTVLNLARQAAYDDFLKLLEFVCRGKLDVAQIPDVYKPFIKFEDAFSVEPYDED